MFRTPEELTKAPTELLKQYLAMGDRSPFPRGAIELALRNQANIKANAQAGQAKAQGNANPNQPTTIVDRIAEAVKEKLKSETSEPRQESMAGIGALPVGDEIFRAAEGGIVSFAGGEKVESSVPSNVQSFVAEMLPYANEVSKNTGIPPHILIGQAGLETGWGSRLPRNPDGTPSYNLFGIKPGSNWKGPTTSSRTMEEIGGKMTPVTDSFRSYGSPAESMADWADLMSKPQYAKARAAMSDPAAFGREIKLAGYATDSAYPQKVTDTINLAQRGISTLGSSSGTKNYGERRNMYRGDDDALLAKYKKSATTSASAPASTATASTTGSPRIDQILAMQKELRQRYEQDMAEIGQSPKPLTEEERMAMTDREFKRRQEREKPYLEELAKLRAAMAPNREALAKEAKDRRFEDFFNALGGSRQRGLRGLLGSVAPAGMIANKPYRESMDQIRTLEDAQRKLEYLGEKEALERSRGNYEKADEIATAMEKARADTIKDIRSQRREAGRGFATEMGGLRQLALMMDTREREEGRNQRAQLSADTRLRLIADKAGEQGVRDYNRIVTNLTKDPSSLAVTASRLRKENPSMSFDESMSKAMDMVLDETAKRLIGVSRPPSAVPPTPTAPKPSAPSATDWEVWLKQP